MRAALAYVASCALILLGGRWAWSFVRPMIEMPVSGGLQATVYSLIVMCALACAAISRARALERR